MADGLASPRVFTRGSFVYLVEPQRVVFLSMDVRSSHTVYTAPDSQSRLVSAVRSGDDMIWMSNNAGEVISVNMQTGTVEEFGRGRVAGGGQIEVDRRFLWLAAGDTLYRMDLTSREWVPLPAPAGGAGVRGLLSFNDQIHIVRANTVHILNTVSEDWVVVPHKNFTLESGDFYKINEAALFVQERVLYRYNPSKRLWDKGPVRGRIRDVHLTPERLAVSTDNRIYQFNLRNFALEPMPAIPLLRNIRAITQHHGRNVSVVERGLAVYHSPFDFNVTAFPEHVSVGDDVFAFSYYNHILLYTNDGFVIHNPERRLWSRVRVQNRNAERRNQYTWDEDGAHISLTENLQSTLHGTATAGVEPNAVYMESGDLDIDLGSFFGNATITVHTEDPDGRAFDITVDNAVTTLPPEKGFYYRGIEGDIVDRASFGVQGSGLTAGQTSPDVLTEGVSAVFSGRSRTENRDRSFMTATAGSGHALSKTEWRSFGHNRSGVYHLDIGSGGEIIPSTVKMYVDGIPLSGADYVYDSGSRNVRLLRRDKSDPTSIIQVSFSARSLPGDANAFELFPENHFGQYNFAEGTVSPRSWLSARAGLLTINNETVTPMVFAGIPVELRGNGADRALLIHPEVIYDNKLGAHSAGVTAGAREGRAFGSYRGFWASRDFDGMDRRTFNNQHMSEEHEVNVGYDLMSNMRASWYQLHRNIDGGNLSHFEARASYTGNYLPDMEMSASARVLENSTGTRSNKETFSLRLSDLSSRLLSETNRIHNVGYDFSWTEYQSGRDQQGRTVYGALNVSPISSLTFAGSGTYFLNPSGHHARSEIIPSLSVYAHDLPRGFDIGSTYAVYITEFRTEGSGVGVGRNLFTYFYPGEYVDALKTVALYFGYANEMESHASPIESPLSYILFSGENTSVIRTSEEFGFAFFPMENLLISSLNARHRDFVNHATYHSHERVKLWLENGSSLEGNLRMSKHQPLFHIHANALYEHRWESGLTTGAGLFGTRNSNDGNIDLSGGPQFILSLIKDLSGSIKSVENSHLLWVTLNTEEMANPDLEYALYLRLKMLPNISVVAELQASIAKMRTAHGGGGLYLHAGF
jgi:hypothetical protein